MFVLLNRAVEVIDQLTQVRQNKGGDGADAHRILLARADIPPHLLIAGKQIFDIYVG